MELKIDIFPKDGIMHVQAKYKPNDINYPHFYLNRDANFISFFCDGKKAAVEACLVNHPMIGDYAVNKIAIPNFSDCLDIAYTLKLSGKTGCFPYVRETIAPEFTFIRWETFCYPMFCDGWDSFRNTYTKPYDIQLTIPAGYEAIASAPITKVQNIASGDRRISYTSCYPGSDIFNCAIAQYTRLDFAFGPIYFLGPIDDEKQQMIEGAMQFALDYMNTHFGYNDFRSDLTYASVPNGLGSFVIPDAGKVFIQESTFDKIETLNQIIHEFIHLGWNAMPKPSVQRTRFFDEAFTSYFETRVMRNLLNDDSINGRSHARPGIDAIKAGQYQLVPINQYGEMEYGDLSYTIGALCLEELCTLLGQPLFDRATKSFLDKHKETPADFEDFCNEYKSFCGKGYEARLTKFFNDWIYSTNALTNHHPGLAPI